jgi:hypothetical protein
VCLNMLPGVFVDSVSVAEQVSRCVPSSVR